MKTPVVHLMHVSRSLHVSEDVILKLRNGLERVRHVLVLLNITDYFCGFGAFGEVDEIRLFDNRGDSVFNEGEVGEVYT